MLEFFQSNAAVYSILKILHIGSLIFWLGPTLGAWWLLRATTYRFGEPSIISQYLYRLFLKVTEIEHIALMTLLITGGLLGMLLDSYQQTWLLIKLTLILVILLPFEALDIWLCHYKLANMFERRHPSTPYAIEENRLLAFYHHQFVPLALLFIPITVLIIFWLVISKPII